jgi:hypothetical protein
MPVSPQSDRLLMPKSMLHDWQHATKSLLQ